MLNTKFGFIGVSHYVKSVRIRSFSGPYFPAFGLNTDGVSLLIQSECGKNSGYRKTQKNSEYGHYSGSAALSLHSPILGIKTEKSNKRL